MKRKIIQAFKAVYSHLNQPLGGSHPQIDFIPPVLFRLVLYLLLIYVLVMLIYEAV